MKHGRYCLIRYAKGIIEKDGYAILKVKLSVNYKYNNVVLIRLILQIVSGNGRCRSCKILSSCHNITSTVTNKTHGIIGNLNCSSTNIIYICECLRCSKQYVGESNGELRVRMNGHRFAINL